MATNSLRFTVAPDGQDVEQEAFIGANIIHEGLVALAKEDPKMLDVSVITPSGNKLTAKVEPPNVILAKTGDAANCGCVLVMPIETGEISFSAIGVKLSLKGWRVGFPCPIGTEARSSTPHLNLPPDVALKRVFADFSPSKWELLDPTHTVADDGTGQKVTWEKWRSQNRDAVDSVMECFKFWGKNYVSTDISTLGFYAHPLRPSAEPMRCDSIAFAGIDETSSDASLQFTRSLIFAKILGPVARGLSYAADIVHYDFVFSRIDWGQYKWVLGLGGFPDLQVTDPRYFWTFRPKTMSYHWASIIPQRKPVRKSYAYLKDGLRGDMQMDLDLADGSVNYDFGEFSISWWYSVQKGSSELSFSTSPSVFWTERATWTENNGTPQSKFLRECIIEWIWTASVSFRAIQDDFNGAVLLNFGQERFGINDVEPQKGWRGDPPESGIVSHSIDAIRHVWKQFSENLSNRPIIQPASQFLFPASGYFNSTSEPAFNDNGTLSYNLKHMSLASGERRDVPVFAGFQMPPLTTLPPKKVEYVAARFQNPRMPPE